MEVKPIYLSKTAWANLLLAGGVFIPGVGDWLQAHPEALTSIFTVMNVVLRLVTKDKISLW